jgi:beta-lactamase class A
MQYLSNTIKNEVAEFGASVYVVLAMLALFALVTIAQVFYPAGRTLPFVQVQGKNVGMMTTHQAALQLQNRYAHARLTVATDNHAYDWSFQESGIDVDAKATAAKAADYPLFKRLIPFSSLGIMVHRNLTVKTRFDDERLNYYAQQVQKTSNVPAVNAGIAVKDGKVVLVPAVAHKAYTTGGTVEALHRAMRSPEPGMRVRVHPNISQAQRSNQSVQKIISLAQKALATPLTLKVDDVETSVDKTTIAGWLEFPEDPQTKTLGLSVKDDVVRQYLATLQPKTYKAPGVTHIITVDGREVGRAPGMPGSGIDTDKSIQSIAETLRAPKSPTVSLATVRYEPTVAYDRQYTNSPAGLVALLADLTKVNGDYAVSVVELGGQLRAANANGDKPFVMASTYKLFVGYAVLKQVEAGQLKWDDKVNGDQTAEVCFEAMMVRSDNPCGEAFGKRIGWNTVEQEMRSQGLVNTHFASFTTTANDLTIFLQKLYGGALLNGSSRDRMLSAMQRQIYRSGIPAGTHVMVANRVGFNDGYLHDAGIVYSPKGPYVMVILSKGGAWSQLANMASQVHAYLMR